MNDQAVLAREIERVRLFFEQSKKNDNCYFRLWNVPFANSNAKSGSYCFSNFDSKSLEDSLDMLTHQVMSVGPYGDCFFKLKHYSTATDGKSLEFTFANPYHNPAFFRGGRGHHHGINGIGGHNQGGNDIILGLMEQHYTSQSDLKAQMAELKHTYELRDKDAIIAELESGNRTFKDAMIGFLEGDTGQTIVAGLMGLLQQKIMSPPEPKQQVEPPPKQEPQAPTPASQAQKQAALKLNTSLERLSKTFDSNGIDVIEHLSLILEERPDLVDQILEPKANNE
jgi:hypothetical protein